MEALIQKYIEANGVTFELRAINEDGDTLITYSGSSFDDVSGYAYLADSNFLKLVRESEEGANDAQDDAVVNNEIDERGEHARTY